MPGVRIQLSPGWIPLMAKIEEHTMTEPVITAREIMHRDVTIVGGHR